MTPTPAELRAATEQAKAEAKARREEEARKEAKKREEHRQYLVDEADKTIDTLERHLGYATQGQVENKISTHIGGSFGWNDEELKLYRELVKPKLEEHFEAQGFGTKWVEDHTTEYGSDGAYPGPTYVKFEVIW